MVFTFLCEISSVTIYNNRKYHNLYFTLRRIGRSNHQTTFYGKIKVSQVPRFVLDGVVTVTTLEEPTKPKLPAAPDRFDILSLQDIEGNEKVTAVSDEALQSKNCWEKSTA